jgi:hypothetical protein
VTATLSVDALHVNDALVTVAAEFVNDPGMVGAAVSGVPAKIG